MTRKRLSREEWLHRALEIVGEGGHGRLRIHGLVKDMGVTRGSFYWHFKDREDFVRSLAEYWVQWSTGQVAERVSEAGSHPRDNLLTLMRIVIEEDLARYDLAIQSWAYQEPAVAEVVDEAMRMRVAYVRSLFRGMGFEGDELETRTLALVGFILFASGANCPETKEEQKRLIENRHAFFTRE